MDRVGAGRAGAGRHHQGRCRKVTHLLEAAAASLANPGIDITVVVSFKRDGNILGHPKITYESEQATDNDRLNYRIAVMEALQRCTPMPFTEGMAGAVAGRPFAIQFHNRKIPPQPAEKRAWLITKIL